MQEAPSRMSEFFSAPKNTMGREAILMHKLIHDLQVAASKCGYYLRAYHVDVDNNGYDLILDCGMYLRKFQVKTVLRSTQTRTWKLQAGVLQPTLQETCDMAMWNIQKIGLGGALIVMEFSLENEEINAQYYYTDLDLITLLRVGWLGNKRQQESARRSLHFILASNFADKISISQSVLFKARNSESLLNLANMQSRKLTMWRENYRRHYGGYTARKGLPPESYLRDQIKNEIGELTV